MKRLFELFSFRTVVLLSPLIIFNQGCALFVKGQINKKFPPVTSIEKRIQAVCSNIKVTDTTKVYDAEVSIAKKLIDSIFLKTLHDDVTQIKFNDTRIDSLSILSVNDIFCLQQLILESNQIVHFNYSRLKNVSYKVSASSAPYYSNDTIYINPYFNSVHIKSIKFKGLGFLTRRKIIYAMVNNLINTHIDNVNGKIQNYFFVVNPVPKGDNLMSSLISKKSENIIIDQDAAIQFEKITPNIAIRIDTDRLQILLAVNKRITDDNFGCGGVTGMTKVEKNAFFCQLYSELTTKWNVISQKFFDTSTNPKYFAQVKIRNGFLAENINHGFYNMDFRFRSLQSFAVNVERSGIYIPKPEIGCPSWRKCLAIPQYCIACNTAKIILRWLPSQIRVGSFGGNLDGNGTLNCRLGTVRVNDEFSTIAISKSLIFNGNLNYDFNYLSDGISIVLGCPILQFKGSPSIFGEIANPDLHVTIEKLNTDSNCIAKFRFAPIIYKIQLNPSPILETFLNIRNYLTCNMSLIATGFALGLIVGNQFNLEGPKQLMNAALTGKYDSEYQLNSIDYPIIYTTKTQYGEIKLKSSWGQKSINAYY